MRHSFAVLVVFLCGSVLTSCGGGGKDGGTNDTGGIIRNELIYPSCELGVGEFAGCWISELCANETVDGSVSSLRLLEAVTEKTNHPLVTGSIRSYLLQYNGDQCAGEPIRIHDIHAEIIKEVRHEVTWNYVQQMDTVCSETGGTSSLLCNAIDITVSSIVGDFPGFTTQLIAGDRLCMPTVDYDFDATGNGNIGAGSQTTRNTIIDLMPGQCLNRFTH